MTIERFVHMNQDRTSLVHLGVHGLRLRFPLLILVEDRGDGDVIASWPEVEAWAAGSTAAEAINALKDRIVELYGELANAPDDTLGKLPRRWKAALCAVVEEAVPRDGAVELLRRAYRAATKRLRAAADAHMLRAQIGARAVCLARKSLARFDANEPMESDLLEDAARMTRLASSPGAASR